jgi:hypothetical protein
MQISEKQLTNYLALFITAAPRRVIHSLTTNRSSYNKIFVFVY